MSLAQINASLQAALSSVGYFTNTTIPQAKQDLTALYDNLNTVTTSIKALPTSNISAIQLLGIVPQGITAAVSAARTTSIIKNLSSPVTPEEGVYFVTTIRNLQTVISDLLVAGNARIPAVEAAIPGLSKLGLNTLKSSIDALAQALIAAIPSPNDKSSIQAIQSSIDAAIQASLTRVPA